MNKKKLRDSTRLHLATAGIFSLFIFNLILFNYSHATSSDFAQDVRALLLKDVRSIDSSGIPGVLACEGGQSVPIVMGKISKVEMPVAVAAYYEKGRIVALGHPDFYSEGAFKKADTAIFMRNAFQWTMHDKPIVCVFKNNGVIPALQSLLSTNAQVIELKDWSQLSATTGTLVGYAEDIPEKEIEHVRAYLKQGGGFMTSAIGWGWMMVSKKSVKGESRFNRLLNPAGLYVADGLLERTSDNGFAVKPIPLGATVFEALDIVASEKPIKASLAQSSATLCTIKMLLDDNDTSIMGKRLTAFMQSASANGVPTKKNPVRETDVAARLKLIAFQSTWLSKPLQNWPASPAATSYPGIVDKNVLREAKTMAINLDVPKWHSTGLFASAGEPVTVTLPPGAERKKLRLRIGSTTCDNTRHGQWSRAPKVDIEVPLATPTTTFASPFGGLVYVVVSDSVQGEERAVAVTVSGVCKAAWFKVGRDSRADWEKIKTAPAPYGEIESNNVILTVPREQLLTVADPVALMKFWDDVADLDAKLAVLPATRRYAERLVGDDQLCAGWMHAGYPIMIPNVTTKEIVNLDLLKAKGDWGFFHEIGHNHQNHDWTFDGTGEVTVNFFTLYCMEKMCGIAPRQTRMKNEATQAYTEWIKNGKPYDAWKSNPFLALEMFVRLQQAYGWEAFEKLFAVYRNLPEGERPTNDLQKRDQWCTRLSRVTGENIASIFDSWNIPISDEARRACATYPKPKDTRVFAN
ncbi:MAG: M60 family metallopeptidase [bacterium]